MYAQSYQFPPEWSTNKQLVIVQNYRNDQRDPLTRIAGRAWEPGRGRMGKVQHIFYEVCCTSFACQIPACTPRRGQAKQAPSGKSVDFWRRVGPPHLLRCGRGYLIPRIKVDGGNHRTLIALQRPRFMLESAHIAGDGYLTALSAADPSMSKCPFALEAVTGQTIQVETDRDLSHSFGFYGTTFRHGFHPGTCRGG